MESTTQLVTINSFVSPPITQGSISAFPAKEGFLKEPSEKHPRTLSRAIDPESSRIPHFQEKISETFTTPGITERYDVDPQPRDTEGKRDIREDKKFKENRNTEQAKVIESTPQEKSGLKLLTAQEKVEVRALQSKDQKVKMHEMAYVAAGGQYAGAARYAYKTGPDGRRYAVGGEVPIDVSKEKDPEHTIQKMAQVKRAALAPADPSAADRAIAAKATQIIAQADRELIKRRMEEEKASDESSPDKVSKGIRSYLEQGKCSTVSGNDTTAGAPDTSATTISGSMEKLERHQISGAIVNLFS
jgi:hypothetical protein